MADLIFHKISWTQFAKDSLALGKKIKQKKIKVDKIVAISRGGLVPARILSDSLSVPISHITISSYKGTKQTNEPFIDETPMKNFRGETILIVDEVCDTGKTFERALSYFRNFSVKKIYTAAPYTKSHRTFDPDFATKNIDAWIIFPYDIRETTETFRDIYKDETKVRKQLLEVGFEEWELEE